MKHRIVVNKEIVRKISQALEITERAVYLYLTFERHGVKGEMARAMALEMGGEEIFKPKDSEAV